MSEPPAQSPPGDHGGFEGRQADLFDHAFTVCYDLSYRGVTAEPLGSGRPVHSARRALPLEAIGSVDRDDEHAMYALRLGCYAGQTAAFVSANFTPPPGWDEGEFPEPPPGEPDRAPQVVPTGTPGAFRGVLVHEADLRIEVGDVRVYADRIRFVVSIVPVGQEQLRPEHSDPLPWPARTPHPDAFCLSVHLPDETTLEATLRPTWPEQTRQLILDDAAIGPSDATLRYWLIGRLPSEGPVTIACDWPAANVSGTITAPIAALRAGL
jgi:hypothetical protein